MPRIRSLVVPFAAAALAAACASSPQAAGPRSAPAPSPSPATAAPAPAPQAASAVGVYEFSTQVQGQTVSGSAIITFRDGKYGGTISTSAMPELPISTVTVNDRTITLVAATPDGDVTIEMVMDGMDFTGTWAIAGQSGALQGRKKG